MAEACTITEAQRPKNPDGLVSAFKSKLEYVDFDWTASAAGAVSTSNIGRTTKYYTGFLLMVETDPDGTNAPTAYTLTVLNDQGSDVMCGAGATARSTTANEFLQPTPNSVPGPVPLNGTRLELQIASAGNGGQGRVRAHILNR